MTSVGFSYKDGAIVHGTHSQYHSQGESSYYAEIANSPQVKHLVETIRDDASKVRAFLFYLEGDLPPISEQFSSNNCV